MQENDTTVGNYDVMTFLSGISEDQLWFRQVGNDLEVSIIGTTDKALIQNWYLGTQYHVEEFRTLGQPGAARLAGPGPGQRDGGVRAAGRRGRRRCRRPTSPTLLPVIAAEWI